MKRKYKCYMIILILLVVITVFSIWQNNDIDISEYQIKHHDIPNIFTNQTILHISDLHNKGFGRKQARLIKLTKAINPDIIVITGDLISRNTHNFVSSLTYLEAAVKIAPVYYVSGNHENGNLLFADLVIELEALGVNILDNRNSQWVINNRMINIIGVNDFSFFNDIEVMKDIINELKKADQYNILLSHRPELLEMYSQTDVELVLAGHAHGGQVRLPLIGGLIAPDQGLFPKYTQGVYNLNNTQMLVSRGLGNSIIPVRVFNRPELVVIKLINLEK